MSRLNSDIAALALEVNVGFKFVIISIYIPPDYHLNISELHNIVKVCQLPYILLGDVNAWSTLWGSKSTNAREKVIEKFIMQENLVVLNDGNPTHFSSHSTFTHVDILCCSASLAPKLACNTLIDLHGSDHFPLFSNLHSYCMTSNKRKTRFILEKANWNTFSQFAYDFENKTPYSHNINTEAISITKAIRYAAHNSIPQTSGKSIRSSVPYWSDELASLRRIKMKYWESYKKHPSYESLINYKKANAFFKKKLKVARRQSLDLLTASINPKSSCKHIWMKVKMLSGAKVCPNISVIDSDKGSFIEASDIANSFGDFWSSYSRDQNFHSIFVDSKNAIFSSDYSNNTPDAIASTLEEPFTEFEFTVTLSALKGKTL